MLSSIRLQQFRSYSDSSFELDGGVNIIVGPNGSGKTNLLEGILVLATGKSYRVKDANLIQFEKPWARLDANSTTGAPRTIKLSHHPTISLSHESTTPPSNNPTKQLTIGSKEYKRLPITQTIPTVLFEPNHLQLLSGSPERRRDFLDGIIGQTTPSYSTVIKQYKRTLAQRNSLLKRNPQASNIFPWDVRLSQLAGQIVKYRVDLTQKINGKINDLYQELSKSSTNVSIKYQNTWTPDQYETKMLKTLETSLKNDIIRGFTSAGPHREDLETRFNGVLAQETASRGEIRTAILALKIIELQLLESARETTPILLLDDVFSELDGSRRHALTSYLEKYQTFITTTDADLVVKNFTQNCHVIALV